MKTLNHNSLFLSQLARLVKTAFDLNTRIFWITLMYYCLLYFCNSNITLFLLSLVYFFSLWKITKNIVLASFICFLANLPFVKGKSLSLLLLPKEMIHMNVRRDLIFYFPLTLSDFYLCLLLWTGIRFRPQRHQLFHFGIVNSMGLFFIISAISVVFSQIYMVSLLSLLFLFKLFILFLLPEIIIIKRYWVKTGLFVMAAFSLFESFWGLLQFFLRGHLGRYIESFNNMYAYGKVAWENTELLRVSGTFVDPDIFGTFMFMHFVLFFYLWLKQKNNSGFERKLHGVCALFAGVSVYLTGNRILYVVLFVSFVLLMTITKEVRKVIVIIKKPIGVISMICIALILFPYISVRLQNISAVFSDVGSGTFRIQMIQYATRIGLSNLFGVGLGMSPYHFASSFFGENMIFGPDYPHNIFSQVFAETGIFGLVAFIVFLYLTFRPLLIKGLRLSNSHFYLAALAFIVSACFYPLFIPLVELTSFFFLYLGIATFCRL